MRENISKSIEKRKEKKNRSPLFWTFFSFQGRIKINFFIYLFCNESSTEPTKEVMHLLTHCFVSFRVQKVILNFYEQQNFSSSYLNGKRARFETQKS